MRLLTTRPRPPASGAIGTVAVVFVPSGAVSATSMAPLMAKSVRFWTAPVSRTHASQPAPPQGASGDRRASPRAAPGAAAVHGREQRSVAQRQAPARHERDRAQAPAPVPPALSRAVALAA